MRVCCRAGIRGIFRNEAILSHPLPLCRSIEKPFLQLSYLLENLGACSQFMFRRDGCGIGSHIETYQVNRRRSSWLRCLSSYLQWSYIFIRAHSSKAIKSTSSFALRSTLRRASATAIQQVLTPDAEPTQRPKPPHTALAPYSPPPPPTHQNKPAASPPAAYPSPPNSDSSSSKPAPPTKPSRTTSPPSCKPQTPPPPPSPATPSPPPAKSTATATRSHRARYYAGRRRRWPQRSGRGYSAPAPRQRRHRPRHWPAASAGRHRGRYTSTRTARGERPLRPGPG